MVNVNAYAYKLENIIVTVGNRWHDLLSQKYVFKQI